MEPLLGKNIEELRAVCAQYGLKPFAASQMADWLYRKRVRSIEEMTNLPKAADQPAQGGPGGSRQRLHGGPHSLRRPDILDGRH